MLPVIQQACAENGLRDFVCFGTGQKMQAAIEVFKSRCKRERFVILLLPIAKGAEGLTLTEANAVFLLEPAFPAALEQQAVARCRMFFCFWLYRFTFLGFQESIASVKCMKR